ncbi:MAG: hypothetical protein V2B20_00085 [Pseudomonadota bacterium]
MRKTMLIVPRHVRAIAKDGDSQVENPIQPLTEFRNKAAWVLLGEPGAGKSIAFEKEADATDGLFAPIAKFLSDDPDENWQGKTLFLDGLDETRASGGGVSVLLKLRAHLRKLGNPPFRIACRAADWFGSTDSQAISDASPNGYLAVLLLEPLNLTEVQDILSNNHGITDPKNFIEKATSHGIDELLKNPQTLRLLAKAIRDDQWPRTRQDTYQLACEKLAGEDSKPHRDRLRDQPIPTDNLLEAAGQLCAVLLLSDRTGLALDTDSADQDFPLIDDFSPPDPAAARRVAGRKLFRPSPTGEERFVPSHRSIAEYLAAQWLAKQIDHCGLPLRRVMNLLLGQDYRTVAGLRGLYGWLALHCQAARSRLIKADPLTVIIYGDVKPMSLADKRHLLAGLQYEIAQNLAFRWQIPSVIPFGALADPELAEDFAAALNSPERNELSQSFAECVLDILYEGDPISELRGTLKTILLDDTRRQRIRRDAMLAWLNQRPPHDEAISLLDSINDGRVADPDDQLAGQLLQHLYPDAIAPEVLLRYLHAPKEQNHIGSYSMFWGYELPKIAPTSHLPILLDQLAARTDLSFSDEIDFSYDCRRMLGALLTRGIEIHGENIADVRLFIWLGIGTDKYGEIQRDKEHLEAISRWLENHPERYKAILALCFNQCESAEHVGYCIHTHKNRLHGAAVPEDIGLWHLEQASQNAGDALAEQHIIEAVSAFIQQRGSTGLLLETIEAWGETHPQRQHWLSPLLRCEIDDWRKENATKAKARKLQHDESRRIRTIAVSKHLATIRSGTGKARQLLELAGVWMNRYSDIHGETPLERFDSYCENGAEALAAAEAGFLLCPERRDLPSVAEIIDLSTKQQEHLIRQPCLIGMELRWRQGVPFIDALSDDTLRRMLAFLLAFGTDNTPEWFTHFVREHPALVAEVLVDYASTTLKVGKDSVSCIYPLVHDPDYQNVAQAAALPLLARFPVRARSGQLSQLAYLLKAALRYSAEQLPGILKKKLVLKGMDVAQKMYWLTTAMLLDPAKHEPALWQYIGKSWTRANHLLAFLNDRFADLSNDYPLSVRTIGKLIELLTPHAELEQRSGIVNHSMQRGESVRAMVTRLGSLATKEAAQEIERLLTLPTLNKLKFSLENARYQVRLRQREAAFRFPPVPIVATIIANREPTSAADLTALTVEHLDEIAYEIRYDNDDGVRAFWNIENKKPTGKREENLCRDSLLTRLRTHLTSFGIDCQPEGDYAHDKRADIRLSYRNELDLPIEIKRDDNRSLWTALHSQLIGQYTIAPIAAGHGIYLVLWFGQNDLPAVKDGGKKPTSPEDLQTRLEALLDAEERRRIFVRVLDVSWM